MFQTDTDAAVFPTERLEAELCRLAAQSAALMCRWLLLVAEYDRREAALSWGCVSTAQWLAWKCAIDPRTAREHVRVARSLEQLPAIKAGFASGELTYSKVRALTRVATADTEEDLLDFARVATAAQLERTLRMYRRVTPHDDEPRPERESEVHPRWDEDGFGSLGGGLRPEEAAAVFAAIDAEAERLADEERSASGSAEPSEGAAREPGSAEPPRRRPSPLAHRRAQALVNMAESYLAERAQGAGDDRFLILLHQEVERSRAWLDGGPGLDEWSVRQLLCDQPVAVLLKDEAGNPLFLGRTTRTLNRAQRRALQFRDGGCCAVPGCTTTVGLQGHHVRWWERDLGPTDITNLVLLCRRHHRLVHHGGLMITADGQGDFSFNRPDGVALEPAPSLPPVDPADGKAAVDEPAGGLAERLDIEAAVYAVCSILRKAG